MGKVLQNFIISFFTLASVLAVVIWTELLIRETFGNSWMFPDLKRDRETASPECRYWAGTGKRMFPNARDREFPKFFREISGSREIAFGNADL